MLPDKNGRGVNCEARGKENCPNSMSPINALQRYCSTRWVTPALLWVYCKPASPVSCISVRKIKSCLMLQPWGWMVSKSGLVWVSGDGRLEDREGHCEMKARDLPDRHQSLNVRFEKGAGRTLQIKLLLSDHIWCTRHVWHDYPWMWPCLCTQQRVWDSKSDRASSPKWILNNKRGLWSACIRFLSNLFLPLFCSLHWLFRIECVFLFYLVAQVPCWFANNF